jgi:membrane-associated protease RseP (regulator of RpoE activity)
MLLGIILFLLSISAHEVGHALAMKRHGIEIQEICLLGFGPKITSFTLPKIFGTTLVTIRLFPLGAFVKPTNTSGFRMLRMSYSGRVDIAGSGVIANILYATILFGIAFLINGHILELLFLIPLLLIGLFPRFTSHLVLPLGIFFLINIIWSLIVSPHESIKGAGSVVMIYQIIGKHTVSMSEIFLYAGFLSLAIGGTNCLPFLPLDGGHIFSTTLEKLFPKNRRDMITFARIASILPILFLLFISLKGDIGRLIEMFK